MEVIAAISVATVIVTATFALYISTRRKSDDKSLLG
jgi:hypothetical protein